MTLKELWIHTKFQIRSHWMLWVAVAVAVTVGLIVALFPPALVFLLSIAPILSSSFLPAAVHAGCAVFLVCGAFNAICFFQRKYNNAAMAISRASTIVGIGACILIAIGTTIPAMIAVIIPATIAVTIAGIIVIINISALVTNAIDSKICHKNLRENYKSELDIYQRSKEPESKSAPSPVPKVGILSSFCQCLRRMNCCRSDSIVPDTDYIVPRSQAQAFFSALKPPHQKEILNDKKSRVANPAF